MVRTKHLKFIENEFPGYSFLQPETINGIFADPGTLDTTQDVQDDSSECETDSDEVEIDLADSVIQDETQNDVEVDMDIVTHIPENPSTYGQAEEEDNNNGPQQDDEVEVDEDVHQYGHGNAQETLNWMEGRNRVDKVTDTTFALAEAVTSHTLTQHYPKESAYQTILLSQQL